jgi:26S proteasome regulatory subunit N8
MAPPSQVTIHPLVLLSVVDHYARVAKDTKKRVVARQAVRSGRGRIHPATFFDMSRVFAVPFEEDTTDSTIWFMDHSYMENMERMFRKVNGTFGYS